MLAAGYTAVGEFHYLGAAEARAAAEAAADAGIAIVLPARRLRARRSRAHAAAVRRRVPRRGGGAAAEGIRVGVAPHSVRACPVTGSRRSAGTPTRGAAAARPRRRAAPRDRGVSRRARLRPIELLAAPGASPSGRRSSTRRTRTERARPARRARRDDLRLPDDRGRPRRRLPAGGRVAHRRIPLCIGIRLERPHRPVRGAARARGDRTPSERHPRRPLDRELLEIGTGGGAHALGLTRQRPADRDRSRPPSLAGVAAEHVRAALVAGCAADVVVAEALLTATCRVDVTEHTFEDDVVNGRTPCPWSSTSGPSGAGRAMRSRRCSSRQSQRGTEPSSWRRSTSTPIPGSRDGSGVRDPGREGLPRRPRGGGVRG